MPAEGRTQANDADTWRLIAKTAVFTVLFPGTVTVLLPTVILGRTGGLHLPGRSVRLVLSVLLLAVGVGMYLACAGAFVSAGRGTPAPIDPPRRLVVQGLYLRSRNPMYLAVLTVLLGEALLFASAALLVYAAIVLGVFQLFVVLYEEPTLRGTFGEAYERYCRAVPRWFGRARVR